MDTGLGEPERGKGRGLSGPFLLVIILFAGVAWDAWYNAGGFIVSNDWRANRGLFTGAVLVVALFLWLAVLNAARGGERKPRPDAAVEVVRSGNWALQPVIALVLLLVTASVMLGQTIPKYVHRMETQQRATVPFIVAATPGADRRGCRPAPAHSPDFGDVTLCVPDSVATSLSADATVYVSGDRTRFGLQPEMYALRQEDAPPSDPTPIPSGDNGVGFNVNDILKQLGVDGGDSNEATVPPVPPEVTTSFPPPATTTQLPPPPRNLGGKEKNR